MDLGLSGKRVLVTGGGRGIGRAVALAFAAEGARVAVCARTRADLEATVLAMGSGQAIVGDVSTPEGATAVVDDAVTALGGLDVLVNNAGGSLGVGTFDLATAADWSRVVNLNLMSAVWCSQRALACFKANGREHNGVIVHLSSVYGREYGPSAPYVAAKAAIISLTKEMGVDLAQHGVRVCSVAPGSILFPGGSWDRRRTQDPARFAAVEKEIPWGRFGAAGEVANAVVFLASTPASWITGVTLPVDGGQGRAP